MKKVRFIDFRSFKDTGDIELKPLNIFVGANSSGKSSILRFFPLMKNSVRVKKRGTFVWYNDDVDFGDFKNVVRQGQRKATFQFCIDRLRLVGGVRIGSILGIVRNSMVRFTIIPDEGHLDRIESMDVICENGKLHVYFDLSDEEHPNIVVADTILDGKEEKLFVINSEKGILPELSYEERYGRFLYFSPELYEFLIDLRMKEGKSVNILRLSEKDFFLRMYSKIHTGDEGGKAAEELYKVFLFWLCNAIIDSINHELVTFSEGIRYIAPLRVSCERYYRYRSDSVDEVDSDGTNLPMFLFNKSAAERKQYAENIEKAIGLRVEVLSHEGHCEIVGTGENFKKRNLADLGFGYSQILPVVVSILEAISKKKIKTSTIVIEQPELHLHPRLQDLFATMVVNMLAEYNKEERRLQFLIETHSERILNRIGELIYEKKIGSDDVSVNLVEKDDNGISSIRTTNYSEEGYLIDWPIDFI